MSESKRKIFTGAQKAKVALEAVKGAKTINEIAQEYGGNRQFLHLLIEVSKWAVTDQLASKGV